jgi:glycosyltransferase involved in cell wall biosynthesis
MLRKLRRLTRLYRLLFLEDRVQSLEWRSGIELRALREQVDHLLSSREVPLELADEFEAWKQRHPVPDQPLVSICVATYNRARLLTERCIPSVLGQTYPRFEMIVVGDGCTDETEKSVAAIADPRVKFTNLAERGAYPSDPMLRWMVAGSQAMNEAMARASGDYVTHLDDDDEFTPDRLEKLVAFARSHDCDFVWHPYWGEGDNGRWVLRDALDFSLGQVTTSSVFYRAWLTRFKWNVDSYELREPGDWNRFRRIKHLKPVCRRYPEPLLRHYRERSQKQ